MADLNQMKSKLRKRRVQGFTAHLKASGVSPEEIQRKGKKYVAQLDKLEAGLGKARDAALAGAQA